MGEKKVSVYAIVVIYQPNTELLLKLLGLITSQVDKVLVIDNASDNTNRVFFNQLTKIEYHRFDSNYGIAYAQNTAFEIALKRNADYVILLDQDSIPSTRLVKSLLNEMIDESVAAAGSIYYDKRSDKFSYFVTERNWMPSKWYPDGNVAQSSLEVVHLISSGTMIKLSILKKVNGMRSDYFIDLVDTEWSFRVRSYGYRLVGVPLATIEHFLGDDVKPVWFFGWRHVSNHIPLRDYYLFRNTLLMTKSKSLSIRWKIYFLWRLVQRMLYVVVFASSRLERAEKILLGINHGLRNVSGKLNNHIVDKIPLTEVDPLNIKSI